MLTLTKKTCHQAPVKQSTRKEAEEVLAHSKPTPNLRESCHGSRHTRAVAVAVGYSSSQTAGQAMRQATTTVLPSSMVHRQEPWEKALKGFLLAKAGTASTDSRRPKERTAAAAPLSLTPSPKALAAMQGRKCATTQSNPNRNSHSKSHSNRSRLRSIPAMRTSTGMSKK